MKVNLKNWYIFADKKLIRPIKRSYRNPEYFARACSIGMGLAFAPIPGQVPVVALIWAAARKYKWRFSLVAALAWTFISNVFTNLPLFYGYYRLGSFLRGSGEVLSYDKIKGLFAEGMLRGIQDMFTELGMSILLGSSLLMAFFAIFGYVFGYWAARKAVDNKS